MRPAATASAVSREDAHLLLERLPTEGVPWPWGRRLGHQWCRESEASMTPKPPAHATLPPRSANGWPVLDGDQTTRWALPGADRAFTLAPGPAGLVLAHFALWFHEQVEALNVSPWDDWGYARRLIRGSSATWSNHASGTAVDLNATVHPLGVRNTFSERHYAAIRARLRGRYAETIAWGAEWRSRPDEMHYEIAAGESDVAALGDHLRRTARGRRLLAANPSDAA